MVAPFMMAILKGYRVIDSDDSCYVLIHSFHDFLLDGLCLSVCLSIHPHLSIPTRTHTYT